MNMENDPRWPPPPINGIFYNFFSNPSLIGVEENEENNQIIC